MQQIFPTPSHIIQIGQGLVLLATFFAVLFYTWQTKRQNDLLIKPSITVEHDTSNHKIYIKNIGNAAALNVQIESIYTPFKKDLYLNTFYTVIERGKKYEIGFVYESNFPAIIKDKEIFDPDYYYDLDNNKGVKGSHSRIVFSYQDVKYKRHKDKLIINAEGIFNKKV